MSDKQQDVALPPAREEFDDEYNRPVTAMSRFNDTVWVIKDELPVPAAGVKNINWGWELPNGDSFLLPRYDSMRLTLKRLGSDLIKGKHSRPTKPQDVIGAVYVWRRFVFFLVSLPAPVYCFPDVGKKHLSDYFEYLEACPGRRDKTLSPATLAKHYLYLNYLYDFRESLPGGLRVRPSGDKSAMGAAKHRGFTGLQTQFIPDEEAKRLLNESIAYVDTYSPILFDCWRRLADLKDSTRFRAVNPTRRRTLVKRLLNEYRPGSSFAAGTPFENGFASIRKYRAELIRLRTACFIVIGFSTGMRIGEIGSIKTGCVGTEETRNHGTFYWLTAMSYKTERSRSGVLRKWMCGSRAARAIRVLEELADLIGSTRDTQYLFTSLCYLAVAAKSGRRRFKPAAIGTLRQALKDFCARAGTKINIHPHMFRRTFARNVVRVGSVSLLALKEHFKHWSLYMTDWYVGLDPDLIREYEAERQLLSMELMEKICVGRVSGPGGRQWTIQLNKRIEEGRLPRSFRGKAGSEFRKSLIKDIHGMGSIVIPCGGFTYCVFNKEQALCTNGDSPLTSRCDHLGCKNSFIAEEHLPFHKAKLNEDEAFYRGLSEAEKQSPLGESLRREISKRHKLLDSLERESPID